MKEELLWQGQVEPGPGQQASQPSTGGEPPQRPAGPPGPRPRAEPGYKGDSAQSPWNCRKGNGPSPSSPRDSRSPGRRCRAAFPSTASARWHQPWASFPRHLLLVPRSCSAPVPSAHPRGSSPPITGKAATSSNLLFHRQLGKMCSGALQAAP